MLENKSEMAHAMGLKNFDCTLPQLWLEENAQQITKHHGIPYEDAYDLLRRGTVWCYDDNSLFGEPRYVNARVRELMQVNGASIAVDI